MNALAIQEAYRRIIAKFIVNERELTADVSAGDNAISVTSTRRFLVGEKIVIINQTTGKAEVQTISDIPDNRTIVISAPAIANYPGSNSVIRKILGYETGIEQFIHGIYLGDPAVISHFPAITIDIKSRNSEWLTLESTSETYQIDITVYVTAADYESQYSLMHRYVDAIESALFRSFYPLVEPYEATTLTDDISQSDVLFKISNENMFECKYGWIWFESADYLRANRVRRYLGNGIYELVRPVGQDFSAGDVVIRPLRHFYNALPATTQYGTVNKGTMLKAAVISHQCTEEVRRFTPFIDPLTF